MKHHAAILYVEELLKNKRKEGRTEGKVEDRMRQLLSKKSYLSVSLRCYRL